MDINETQLYIPRIGKYECAINERLMKYIDESKILRALFYSIKALLLLMYQKIGILAVLASVLLSAALLATPNFKVVNAQENQTGGNQTMGSQAQGLDVDKWIVVLKKSNPTLNNIEQSPDVKEAIGKIKAMQDPKEAVKTLDALYTLQQLMNLKSLKEAQ